VEERFGVGVSPETICQHLLATGYRWKRTRYVSSRSPPDPEEERKARGELEELKRGPKRASTSCEVPRRERILLVPAARPHLDSKRAKTPPPSAYPMEGKQGRINLIGALCFEGESKERLEFQLLEGTCRSEEVLAYLDLLAEKPTAEGEAGRGGVGSGPFHRARVV
jgi:hypothetical protein